MSELDRKQIFCDLERCSKQYKEEMESECKKCTYHGMGVNCVLELISDSFSLVKELLEENERLAKTVNETSELTRKSRSNVNKSETEYAREIFEELKQKRKELWYSGKYTMFECWCKVEDELKKKYTEDKK